jgi:hypothetical protein
MPRKLKARLPVPVVVLVFALGGCGGGDDDGASSPVFVEGSIQPKGELKANVEDVVETIAGIDDVGRLIVSELESSAREEGEPVDFAREIEPWLGERAGVFLDEFDGDDFQRVGVAVQTTDPDAAQEFVDEQAEGSDDPVDDASYEGVDYKVDSADESVYGVVGELLVVTEQEAAFKDAVDAANGDSLEDEAAYGDAIAAAAEGSLADVYVDVGLLIEQSDDEIDQGVLKAFESAGIEPREATAVASVVPGADRVEVEISGDLGDQEVPSGDPSELLGSLPADSFAAFAVSGFGTQLEEAIDSLDEEGIPGEVPPGKLKSGLKEVGIDLEEIVGSLDDAGLFVQGRSESTLGGALVLTTDGSSQARNTVSNLGTLLRGTGVPGVTAVTGKASGFSIRDEELGPQPLVVVAKDERIAIGYGMPAALRAVVASGGATLSSDSAYEEAVAALGGTPIALFVDGPRALQLAESLVPRSDEGFRDARRYLRNVESVALGSAADGDRVTAKLIVGLQR